MQALQTKLTTGIQLALKSFKSAAVVSQLRDLRTETPMAYCSGKKCAKLSN